MRLRIFVAGVLLVWIWLAGLLLGADAPGVVSPPFSQHSVAQGLSGLGNSNYLYVSELFEDQGNIYSNLNRFSWTNTAAVIAGRQRPFRLMIVANGLLGEGLYNGFWTNSPFSIAGFAAPGPGYPTTWFHDGSNAFLAGGKSGLIYPNFVVITNTGGYAVLDSGTYPEGITGNVFSVAYLAEPTAGHLLVETQINSGTWTAVSGLSDTNAAATTATKFLFWTNSTPNATRIRVSGLTSGKTNRIFNISAVNSLCTTGVVLNTVWAGAPSTLWTDFICTNQALIIPLFTNFAPDLLLVHGAIDLSAVGGNGTNMPIFLNMCRTNLPRTDVVLVGGYANAGVTLTNDNWGFQTNAALYGWGYFDGLSPFPSTNIMIGRGWIQTDAVHPTPDGCPAFDGLLMRWLSLTNPGTYHKPPGVKDL